MRKKAGNDAQAVKAAAPGAGVALPTTPPIALNDGTYVGEIRTFACELTPASGWRECNGQELNISTHQQLFSVIGSRFGSTAAGTFRIPDTRGTFIRGWNHGKAAGDPPTEDPEANARGLSGGSPAYPGGNDHVGSYQLDVMQSHQHGMDTYGYRQMAGGGGFGGLFGNAPNPFITGPPVTGRVGTETRPCNLSLLFCIRDPNWNVTP